MIIKISKRYNLKVIEDAAESLGSFYKNKHTGTYGDLGVLSFNGNKIITTGAGGAVLTNNKNYALKIKSLVEQAKVRHTYKFNYASVGYNLKMPGLNASLGMAQIKKRKRYSRYEFEKSGSTRSCRSLDAFSNCLSHSWIY